MWAVWLDQFQAAEALVNAGAKATREIWGMAELRAAGYDAAVVGRIDGDWPGQISIV